MDSDKEVEESPEIEKDSNYNQKKLGEPILKIKNLSKSKS